VGRIAASAVVAADATGTVAAVAAGGPGGEPPNITIRRPFFRRRKSSPFAHADAPRIDYKDVKLLQRFVSERGKIVPRRITAVTAKEQRRLGPGDQAGARAGAPALPRRLVRAAAATDLDRTGNLPDADHPPGARAEPRPDGRGR
jgi:small subunit ribosomal protein S18